MIIHDYDSFQYINRHKPCLLEVYSGTSIVQWGGNIERQLQKMLDEQEASRNFDYANKIRTFLTTWRENEITGSINRDTLDILKAATSILAVDNWNLNPYFSNLRDQLRKLIASEEELPRGTDMDQNIPMSQGPRGGSAPPLGPEFGPEEKMPKGLEAALGGETPEEEKPEEEKPLTP